MSNDASRTTFGTLTTQPKAGSDGSPVFTPVYGSADDMLVRNPAPDAGAVAAPSGAYREYKIAQ